MVESFLNIHNWSSTVETALRTLNELVQEGLLKDYAVGGAMALLFYSEPALTYDLDVFCLLPDQASKLITLEPLYAWFRAHGFQEEREHVIIGGLPMQLIPAYNTLVEEAIREAQTKDYRGLAIRVLRLEYLVALMLQTGRAKDLLRAAQVREEAVMDAPVLADILKRYDLETKWSSLP